MGLMLVGSVGLATSIAGILAGVVGKADSGDRLTRAAVLVGGLACIYAISASNRVDRRLSAVIGRGLARFTDLDVRDYAALLHVSGEYEVKEMLAVPGAWITGRRWGSSGYVTKGFSFSGSSVRTAPTSASPPSARASNPGTP